MAKVTLIGEYLAQINNEFIFLGPLHDCKECKLTHICFNLKPFHHYKIIKIRKKRHTCNVHQSNTVVVEVQEQPITVSIDKKHTKGSTISIEQIDCDQQLCKYYDYCQNHAIKPNWKYKITSIIEDIDCPKDNSIQLVEVTE